MQPPVNVVRASAGSGKTYRLTHDYLELLLAGDPLRYKHILAVTFTNKATDEMKARVIDALYQLSRSKGPRAALAADRLKRMLHDYSCFSVSTIDKFFQTVMRAFAREIGQYASYRVELDDSAVTGLAVDEMLASLDEPASQALLHWLKDYSFDLVEQGKGWNIAEPLKAMAAHFLDETFLRKMRSVSSIIDDKARVEAFRRKLEGMIAGYEGEARRIAKEALAVMERNGYGPGDFKGKSRGPMLMFAKWAAGDFVAPRPEALRESFDKFPDQAALSDQVEAAIAHYSQNHVLYNSAKIVRENLHLLGIYSDVLHHLQNYLQENNIVLLKQSTDLLNRIIGEDDTPFVYEKIGNRYDHLMLDEAQDTSLLQWDNFKPLFLNSIAQGSQSLVVGDIKQSIYRWRGSDWRLLSEYLRRDLGSPALNEETLKENWRSGEAVIAFNNRIFSQAGAVFTQAGAGAVGAAVGAIYDDCAQTRPDAHAVDPEGFVRLQFLPADDPDKPWRQAALERMLVDIDALKAEGYAPKDITVLVRKNEEGNEVASWLIAHGHHVLTEDSLQIGASPCIGRVMALLASIVDPDDPVNAVMLEQLGLQVPELEGGSLYETCERLLDLPGMTHTEADLPFIHTFLDAVLDYQVKYGSSLRGFVRWWDESGYKKAICAPDGQDAVRVMTVHKSKGLSLEAVIIPFVNESFVPHPLLQPTLWCETSGPFAELGIIPLKASSRLADTCFAADYERELIYEHIDVVNTWYVAFTRARSRLLLYAPQPKPNAAMTGIGDLLYRVFKDELDKETAAYSDGTRAAFVRKAQDRTLTDDPQPAFSRVAMTSDRLKLLFKGEDFFSAEASARRRGIEEHERMATVEVDAELERRSGGRHWFDGTYEVHNEASVVTGAGEIYRPDRVLIARDGSRVIVIDYKFGAPRPSHHRQVRQYTTLLRQMGYPIVEGYLWYLPTNTIETV